MKSTTLFLLLCAFFFTSTLPSATAVVDTDGNILSNPGTYFILSVWRPGGGVEFAATGNETCPLTVVNPLFGRGLPVILSSRLRIATISEGQLFSIKFTIVPWCATTPSLWTVVKDLPQSPSPAVKLTGYQNTVSGEFKIEKASPFHNDYVLLFCPSGEESKCGHIGLDEKRGLVVSDEVRVFTFQFQKFGSIPELEEASLSGSE